MLLTYPPEMLLSAVQLSRVPGFLSWSLLFCRKGIMIKRACQELELTVQVLSTRDKLKRRRERGREIEKG